MQPRGDLNVIGAAQLARVLDRGGPRRGREQDEIDLLDDGAVAIRDGRIVAVGKTEAVLGEFGEDGVETIDASGKTVLPGLVECHSHPLFGGERHAEYGRRLNGASLAEIAAEGGGIWASVTATRRTPTQVLSDRIRAAYGRILAGGVTTLEVKSGYGLTVGHELEHLRLLQRSQELTSMELVITFLGAHVVPRDGCDADGFVSEIESAMLPAVAEQRIASFHDVTCEQGLFTTEQAARLLRASGQVDLPTRVHADAWAPSEGWKTAAEGGASSADHLTYTPDEEIRAVGRTDTVAVLLPAAELIYLTERRANARLFIEYDVPVAIATDYCSSIHATSLTRTIALAAPWFGISPAMAIVGATLNAAYSLGLGKDRGSIDVGRRGDLTLLDCAHPDELCLALGDVPVHEVVIGGKAQLPSLRNGAEDPP